MFYPQTPHTIFEALTDPKQERWTIKALAAVVIQEASYGWPLMPSACGGLVATGCTGPCCWHAAPTAADEAQILADVRRVIERLDEMGRLSMIFTRRGIEYRLIESGGAPIPYRCF